MKGTWKNWRANLKRQKEFLRLAEEANRGDALLDRFYERDGEYTVLRLRFGHFADILDPNTVSEVPRISSDFFEYVDEMLAEITQTHALRLKLEFADADGYTQEQINAILSANFMLKAKKLAVSDRRQKLFSLWLTLGGVALLLFSYLMSLLAARQILFDIVNIAGTLFIWEAAYHFFIERAENNHRKYRTMGILINGFVIETPQSDVSVAKP